MRPHLDRILAVMLAIALLALPACGGGGRPSVADWEPTWEDTLGAIPTSVSLGDPPDREVCSHALGILRSHQPDLFPTPDPAIEGVVKKWVRIAEHAMFECPPSSHKIPDLAYAYEELAHLQAEVDAVLSINLSNS